MSVGAVSDAMARIMVEQNPGIGDEHDVIIPVVGECDDSWLNDITGRHVREEHVRAAVALAAGGAVGEGSVGGGTGMVTCDFKAGIGTSSRKLPESHGGYTLGVLVMSNFGKMHNLRVGGLPLGEALEERFAEVPRRGTTYGSIIAVVATDAPLLPNQLNRLCRRVALGIGRVGSYAAHGSGEIVVGFSTANVIPRRTRKMVTRVKFLLDQRLDPLYEAVMEATEEAILNSMCMAGPMTGINGHHCPALPLDEVRRFVDAVRPALGGRRRAPPPLPAGRPRPGGDGHRGRCPPHRRPGRRGHPLSDPRAVRRRATGDAPGGGSARARPPPDLTGRPQEGRAPNGPQPEQAPPQADEDQAALEEAPRAQEGRGAAAGQVGARSRSQHSPFDSLPRCVIPTTRRAALAPPTVRRGLT